MDFQDLDKALTVGNEFYEPNDDEEKVSTEALHKAKAFLSVVSPKSNISLYDLIRKIIEKVLRQHHENSVDEIEKMCRFIKDTNYAEKNELLIVSEPNDDVVNYINTLRSLYELLAGKEIQLNPTIKEVEEEIVIETVLEDVEVDELIVQEEEVAPPTNEIVENPSNVIESETSSQIKADETSSQIKADETPEVSEAQSAVEEFVVSPSSEKISSPSLYVPDVCLQIFRFNQAGVGFSMDETFQIQMAMKVLVLQYKVSDVRFWGKIFAHDCNYYIAEAPFVETIFNEESTLSEGTNPSQPEAEITAEENVENIGNMNPPDENANISSTTEDASALVTNEDASALVTNEDASAPIANEDASAPVTNEDASAPVTKEDVSAPVTNEDASALLTTDDTNLTAVSESTNIQNSTEGGVLPDEPPKRVIPPLPKKRASIAFVLEGNEKAANKFMYFTCTKLGQSWKCLPFLRLSHISQAKALKKYFTGDLDAEVQGYCDFQGTEANYLRAQIARISASTMVAPEGYYRPKAPVLTEEQLERLRQIELEIELQKQREEEEAKKKKKKKKGKEEEKKVEIEEPIPEEPPAEIEDVENNPEFVPLPPNELFDQGLNGWVHHRQALLVQGRYIMMQKPKQLENQGEEPQVIIDETANLETKIEDKVEPEIETELKELPIPLLRSLSEDISGGGMKTWTLKCSLLLNECSVVLLRSNTWPGAFTYYDGRYADHIYIGYGHKYSIRHYAPPVGEKWQIEYSEEINITEPYEEFVSSIVAPSVEDGIKEATTDGFSETTEGGVSEIMESGVSETTEGGVSDEMSTVANVDETYTDSETIVSD